MRRPERRPRPRKRRAVTTRSDRTAPAVAFSVVVRYRRAAIPTCVELGMKRGQLVAHGSWPYLPNSCETAIDTCRRPRPPAVVGPAAAAVVASRASSRWPPNPQPPRPPAATNGTLFLSTGLRRRQPGKWSLAGCLCAQRFRAAKPECESAHT